MHNATSSFPMLGRHLDDNNNGKVLTLEMVSPRSMMRGVVSRHLVSSIVPELQGLDCRVFRRFALAPLEAGAIDTSDDAFAFARATQAT